VENRSAESRLVSVGGGYDHLRQCSRIREQGPAGVAIGIFGASALSETYPDFADLLAEGHPRYSSWRTFTDYESSRGCSGDEITGDHRQRTVDQHSKQSRGRNASSRPRPQMTVRTAARVGSLTAMATRTGSSPPASTSAPTVRRRVKPSLRGNGPGNETNPAGGTKPERQSGLELPIRGAERGARREPEITRVNADSRICGI
jgi:hypothetical protein